MIYQKNFKKILLCDHLQKFKLKISNIGRDMKLLNIMNENLLIHDFSDLSVENFEVLYQEKNVNEKFRNESEFTPSKDSKMSKVMSELQTSTSIKNVFDDYFFVEASQQNKNIQNGQSSQMKKDERVVTNIDDGSGLSPSNCSYQNSSSIEKEKFQMINKELQENIEKYLLIIFISILSILISKGNFEEFKLDQIAKEIFKSFPNFQTSRNNALYTRAECSLIFYNMLIVSQTQNFYLKQNSPNGKLYMIKI
jgi:hypothetical protein